MTCHNRVYIKISVFWSGIVHNTQPLHSSVFPVTHQHNSLVVHCGFFFHLSCSYQNLPCWHWSMSVATWKMESSTEVLTARIDFYRKPVSPIAQWLAVVDCQNKWLHLDPFLIFPHPPFFLSLWWTIICSNLVQWFNIINGGIHYNHQQSSISHVVLWNKNLFATVK